MSALSAEPTGSAPFRYDAAKHLYVCARTGQIRPHITGMLKATGWVNDQFYNEEARFRGSVVHDMTLGLDLDAFTVDEVESHYRGYLLAYANVTAQLKPRYSLYEEALMHSKHRYGGRLDRAGIIKGRASVVEIKTGQPHKSHGVQLALQAILGAEKLYLPPEMIRRWVLYIQEDGSHRARELTDMSDFARARDVIHDTCKE